MLCCGGTPEQKGSSSIDKDIRAEKKKLEYEVKLLLLGAGESGKSTFAKQMKILHMNGYDNEERENYKVIIYRNIVESMRAILRACIEKLDLQLEPENRDRAQRLLEDDNYFTGVFTPQIYDDMRALWTDRGVVQATADSAKFQFPDSAPYYFGNLERIAQATWVPSNQDILRSRTQTTGIVETDFFVEKMHFRMFDVAGQRSERRKWMHCFGDVKSVIVLVGVSEYDQVLFEDENTNRMHEALKLFRDICNSRWFINTTMILFLNKEDLFREKIKRVPLSVCFPAYTGENTYEAAIKFIEDQFLAQNANPNKSIFTHTTCATDTETVNKVFDAVKQTILDEMLDATNM